jgi:hypothetical protein
MPKQFALLVSKAIDMCNYPTPCTEFLYGDSQRRHVYFEKKITRNMQSPQYCTLVDSFYVKCNDVVPGDNTQKQYVQKNLPPSPTPVFRVYYPPLRGLSANRIPRGFATGGGTRGVSSSSLSS